MLAVGTSWSMRATARTLAIIGACAVAPAVGASFHGDEAVDWAMIAPAASSASAPPAPLPTERKWYGWQTLLIDSAAGLMVVGGLYMTNAMGGRAVAGWGGLLFVGGAPAVHIAHGNVGRGLGSLAIRAGGLTLAAVGFSWFAPSEVDVVGGSTNQTTRNLGGLLFLFGGLAVLVAPAIDGAALSYGAKQTVKAPGLSVTPFAAPGRVGLAVGARF